jgi:hypothetical protein
MEWFSMHPDKAAVAFFCLLVLPLAAHAESKGDASGLLLDDFQADSRGWTFIDGREFPGARGDLVLDRGDAHGGTPSYKLRADFSSGGAYVGVWRDLSWLKGRDINELRLRVKAVNVTSLGVRLADSTDQCHQKKGRVKLAATRDWQQVALKVADLVGGEDQLALTGEDLRPWVIYRCQIGSRAFGLAGDDSDDDLRGIYRPLARGRPPAHRPGSASSTARQKRSQGPPGSPCETVEREVWGRVGTSSGTRK